ncbi:MAG: PAS domain-containing sensor histidine kinase [Bacteroidota bacterium]|nr:PAS domain-containing sensor histidine kinase [Bacteroidota bacterium]
MEKSTILYIGFGDLMNSMQSKLSASEGVEFKEILQLSSDVHENLLSEGAIFLIGPYTLEPVRQVQRAHQQNPLISIVVLIFPEQFQKVKHAVQFAYNVGNHVTFVPYDMGKDITAVFDSAILRTRQRKSFSRLTKPEAYPRPVTLDLTYNNLSAFLENAPIGAIIFDQKRNIISANSRAKQLFKQQLEGSANIAWSDIFPDEQSAPPALPSETGDEPLHEIIKVNNQFLEINIAPLAVNEHKPHYLLLLNDVTNKIKAENQLKSKIDELEFLNQELDEFVNVVSHDFKTPLTSISLLAEMGIKEIVQEKQVNFLKQILQSSNKLRELLKGLNVLVDIKKTKSEKVEQVDFEERLNVILPEYTALLNEISGKVVIDFSQAKSMAYFKAHVDSFFSNLITNSIKYRKKDVPLVIEIKSRCEKEYTILYVKDNGIGIDLAKNMNKLFQPFKRLTDHGTGSGLGLSIVKRVIEKNQGYLEVFSQPGEGTEFKAYLKSQQ